MDVIGYVRCSTKEQAMGYSLDVQHAKISEEWRSLAGPAGTLPLHRQLRMLPAQLRTADRAYEPGVDNHVKPPYRSTGHLSTVGRAQLAQLTAKGLPRSFLTGMAV